MAVHKVNSYLSFIFTGLIVCGFISFNFLPVNPVYIIGFILSFISFLLIDFSRVNKFFIFLFIYFVIALLSMSFGLSCFYNIDTTPQIASTILFFYCIMLGLSVYLVGEKIKNEMRVKLYYNISNYLIIFMSVDFFIRLFFSKFSANFYDYKFGIFYLDSNFSATILLCYLFFFLLLKDKKILDIGNFKFVLMFLLLISTFSRAAIFSFIVSYFLIRFGRKFLVPIIVLCVLIGSFILFKMFTFYSSGSDFNNLDPSFNSKFIILSIAIDNYQSLPDINKIFGIGLNNFGFYSNGVFAHNIFITLIYEFGYIGTFLFIFIFIYFFKKMGKESLYLIFPFLICSLSLFSAYMPFYFILMSLFFLEFSSHYKGLINE